MVSKGFFFTRDTTIIAIIAEQPKVSWGVVRIGGKKNIGIKSKKQWADRVSYVCVSRIEFKMPIIGCMPLDICVMHSILSVFISEFSFCCCCTRGLAMLVFFLSNFFGKHDLGVRTLCCCCCCSSSFYCPYHAEIFYSLDFSFCIYQLSVKYNGF